MHKPVETGTVTCIITVDGHPVPEGTELTMLHRQWGFVATGVAEATGKVSMQMEGSSNIVVGEYRVTLSPPTHSDTVDTAGKAQQSARNNQQQSKNAHLDFHEFNSQGEILTVKTAKNQFNLDIKSNSQPVQ